MKTDTDYPHPTTQSGPDSQTDPHQVVVQPSFMVAKLVLQTERLVSSSGYVGFTLQFTPTVIISEPNQVTFAIGHLSWDTEVAVEEVEEVGLLSTFAV